MAQGRYPTLHTFGGFLFSVGLLLLLLGVVVGKWTIAALGFVALVGLCAGYVGFALQVSMVWRRHIELVWWLPRAAHNEGFVAGRPVEARLTLRNLSFLPLRMHDLRISSSRSVHHINQAAFLVLPAHSEATTNIDLLVAQAGEWFVHGATVRLSDHFGLYSLDVYFPAVLRLKVLLPKLPQVVFDIFRSATGSSDQRVGVLSLRRRGLGGDFRELREYVPGDPYKLIAWKATARSPTGRPLVRELERETLRVHYLLLDIGISMREGWPGQWKLDHALQLCQSYARSVLEGSDRLGYIAFDGEILHHLKPGSGPVHLRRLTEKWLDVTSVVEPAFVAMTDGELFSAVARYLRRQEAIETVLPGPPPANDAAAWAQVAVSPTGERISRPHVIQTVQRLLRNSAHAATQTDEQLLRSFCKERGIELPYAQRSALERARGLAQSLELAATMPGAQVVLFSDLLGLALDEPRLGKTAALCRRKGLRLLCVRPKSLEYLPRALLHTPNHQMAATVFSWEQQRLETRAQHDLGRLGFHVLPTGPEDTLSHIFSRRLGSAGPQASEKLTL